MILASKQKVLSGAARALLFLCIAVNGSAQVKDNSLLFEISGKKLDRPSYLFGTFHLIGSGYIDSLPKVNKAFQTSDQLVSEIVLDSTMAIKMMVAAQMEETTLDKLLDTTLYRKTARWLRDLSGYDLQLLNTINPMTVQLFITTLLQQKYFPMTVPGEMPMDMYFQQQAVATGKKVVGLETFETQIYALYNQFSLDRQAEMLSVFVADRDSVQAELILMNRAYRDGDLSRLARIETSETYTPEETAILLDNRNKKWMDQLPALIKAKPTFIAVGALHLTGRNGLVALLRKAGYTVKPVSLK